MSVLITDYRKPVISQSSPQLRLPASVWRTAQIGPAVYPKHYSEMIATRLRAAQVGAEAAAMAAARRKPSVEVETHENPIVNRSFSNTQLCVCVCPVHGALLRSKPAGQHAPSLSSHRHFHLVVVFVVSFLLSPLPLCVLMYSNLCVPVVFILVNLTQHSQTMNMFKFSITWYLAEFYQINPIGCFCCPVVQWRLI
ncbi:unnamed protein product [Calicophoron daubneyi]|uniref:Uncharacterized protein n=1 Tax=Calicophoron daubneyi TaxID=300641 RepID=A0AAV2TTP8_CALDB